MNTRVNPFQVKFYFFSMLSFSFYMYLVHGIWHWWTPLKNSMTSCFRFLRAVSEQSNETCLINKTLQNADFVPIDSVGRTELRTTSRPATSMWTSSTMDGYVLTTKSLSMISCLWFWYHVFLKIPRLSLYHYVQLKFIL